MQPDDFRRALERVLRARLARRGRTTAGSSAQIGAGKGTPCDLVDAASSPTAHARTVTLPCSSAGRRRLPREARAALRGLRRTRRRRRRATVRERAPSRPRGRTGSPSTARRRRRSALVSQPALPRVVAPTRSRPGLPRLDHDHVDASGSRHRATVSVPSSAARPTSPRSARGPPLPKDELDAARGTVPRPAPPQHVVHDGVLLPQHPRSRRSTTSACAVQSATPSTHGRSRRPQGAEYAPTCQVLPPNFPGYAADVSSTPRAGSTASTGRGSR